MTYAEMIDALTNEYIAWWNINVISIEPCDAEEAIHLPNLDAYQRRYLTNFISRWEHVEEERAVGREVW